MTRRTPVPALPRAASAGAKACSVLAASALLGDFWTLAVLRCVVYGVHRYGEIQRELGVATNVLADRLQRLVDAGVLSRSAYQDHPPRYDYGLTPAGQELVGIVLALKRWGDDHLQPDGPSTRLDHRDCGHPVDVSLRCTGCGRTVGRADIRSTFLRPPPGVPARGVEQARTPRGSAGELADRAAAHTRVGDEQ